MPPNLKQHVPPANHAIIREGETFKVNSRNKSRQTYREVVAVRDSRYGQRTKDGTWNTANGFGWVEYRQFINDGDGPIQGCDTGDWLRLLGNMSKVGEGVSRG